MPGHRICFSPCERASGTAVRGDTLRDHITLAVSHWFTTTGEGRAAWEESSEDFNVGDLANALGDARLEESLRLHGIAALTVETHAARGGNHDWPYDEVLITDGAREELEEGAA